MPLLLAVCSRFQDGAQSFTDSSLPPLRLGPRDCHGSRVRAGPCEVGGLHILKVSSGDADFWDAEVTGGYADFWDAEFSGSDTDFQSVVFSGR